MELLRFPVHDDTGWDRTASPRPAPPKRGSGGASAPGDGPEGFLGSLGAGRRASFPAADRVWPPVIRGFQGPADPPPGRGGAGPGSGAPAQLTRPLSPCRLPPRRAGPGRRHVGPVRALGARSQRPALGRQRLLQPPEPALQRGHSQGLRGQRVSRRSESRPAGSSPERIAHPGAGEGAAATAGWGRRGGVAPSELQPGLSRGWAWAGRGLESPPTPTRGAEGLIPAPAPRGPSLPGARRARGAARPAPLTARSRHPLGTRPWVGSGYHVH